MAKKKAVPKSGAMGMSARGKKNIQIWVTPEQDAQIEAAAKIENRPKTQILLMAGMEQVKKILKKAGTVIGSL